MEMQGSLGEFSIAEVLQFLSLHDADGVLRVKKGKEEVNFGFKNGKITDAAHGGENFFFSINEYIIRRGLVSEDELENYKKKADELNISIVELLLQEKIITEEGLKSIISFKIQEIMDELLTWDQGKYSFIAGKKLYEKSEITVELEPNALVMEGMRRIDEWEEIKKVIPDEKITLVRREKPLISISLDDEEKLLLEKFEDGLSVEKLIKKTGLGKFQTFNSVYKLMEIGLLEEKEGEEEEEKKKEKIRRRIKRHKIPYRKILKNAVLVTFILINLVFFFKYRVKRLKNPLMSIKNAVQGLTKYK